MKRLKKHFFKKYDPVLIKWIGEKQLGLIINLTKNKEGYATYSVRSVTVPGCIYHDLHLDDPEDQLSFIFKDSKSKLSQEELEKVSEYRLRRGI
jgi:hypothetical protein